MTRSRGRIVACWLPIAGWGETLSYIDFWSSTWIISCVCDLSKLALPHKLCHAHLQCLLFLLFVDIICKVFYIRKQFESISYNNIVHPHCVKINPDLQYKNYFAIFLNPKKTRRSRKGKPAFFYIRNRFTSISSIPLLQRSLRLIFTTVDKQKNEEKSTKCWWF